MRAVSAGSLPFVRATFGDFEVDALIDTGSPVTMVNPPLGEAAKAQPSADPNDDIITTGVDGQPTRMRASRVASVQLGSKSTQDGPPASAICGAATVYVGLCPMMALVGWQGTPAALLGLDFLRHPSTVFPSSMGNARPAGRLLLDFQSSLLRIDDPAGPTERSDVQRTSGDCRMQLSSGFEFDDGEQLLVSMQKPLGLLLEETATTNAQEDEDAFTGCFVAEVVPEGSASSAGVEAGFELLAVNNMDVSCSGLEEVMACIQQSPRVLNLRFRRAIIKQ